MAEALIDLGEAASSDAVVAMPSPPRRRRPPLLVALGAVLLALLTGAAHHGPPVPPTIIAARLGDLTFVSDDHLLVVGAGPAIADEAVRLKIISAYALPSGTLLSRTTVAVTGPIFSVVAAGPVILVSYRVEGAAAEFTVGAAAGSDRALWRRPARMMSASAADGTVLLRENTPDPAGQSWFGVGLRTGAILWTMREPVRGFSDLVTPGLLLTATDRGLLDVRDTRSGAITARRTVPLRKRPPGADVPVWPAGDLVMVGTEQGTIAYTLPGLTERWRSGLDLTGRWVQPDCVLICSLSWQGGLWLLDRDTGERRWSDDRWNYADQAGEHLLVTDNEPGEDDRTVSVLDAETGRVRGDFGRWHSIGAPRSDGTVMGLREQLVDSVVWYARLDPGTLGVRVIGKAAEVSGDCRTTPDVLVCRRVDATVGLWQLK
jgi:hypothetical protein